MKNENLKVEYININELRPWENNAKQHPREQVEQIKKSIEMYGMADPIGIWKDNTVIEGHGRLMACKELGIEEVPVIRLDDLTDKERREYMLVHNQTTMNSGWDFEKLEEELKDLDFGDFDFGFDLDFGTDEEKEVEEDEAPKVPEEPKARLGDLYILGQHRLICGDSTDANVIDRLMEGEKADLTFQSPPYNIGKNAQLNDRDDDNKYINYNDDNPEYKQLLTETTENAINNSRYAAINIQMLSGNKKDFAQWLSDFKDYLCDIAIWYKDNVAPAMARKVMNSSFEFIVFFSKENQSRAIGTNDFRGDVSNVYQSHIQSGNEYSKIHSATFPVEFAGHFIKNFTNKGDSVLDLFGGSGSTLIACEQLNRKCYMCELEPRYIDVIIQRYINLKGSDEDVFLVRDGEKIPYKELAQ